MITREQVADLRPGDVVEITDHLLCTTRGPLRAGPAETLLLGAFCVVRYSDGDPARPDWSLTVITRAPRPLYVNHDRAEPVPGDVAREGTGAGFRIWLLADPGSQFPWIVNGRRTAEYDWRGPSELPPLRLLVDGETGQVVP